MFSYSYPPPQVQPMPSMGPAVMGYPPWAPAAPQVGVTAPSTTSGYVHTALPEATAPPLQMPNIPHLIQVHATLPKELMTPPPPPPAQAATTGITVQNIQYNTAPSPAPALSPMIPVARSVPSNWSTGIFNCHEDIENCLITWCCPCITFGQIAVILDRNGNSTVWCCMAYVLAMHCYAHCLLSLLYRKKLRDQYDLGEEFMPDLAIHLLCEPCSLCQMHRELNLRRRDTLASGRSTRRATVPPVPMVRMTR